MTSEDTVAELRLAGMVARDLLPQRRAGRFLMALADEVADGVVPASEACAVAVVAAILQYRPGLRLHGFGVKSTGTLLSCLDLRSVDSEAWSTRGRYTERDLRAAVGLPPSATWLELRAAMERMWDTVDLDLLEIFEWKRDHGEEAAIQNSIEWAEQWRARQQMRIAAAVMGRAAELAYEHFPGQREMWAL